MKSNEERDPNATVPISEERAEELSRTRPAGPPAFPPPQVVAGQAYLRMIQDMNKEGVSPAEIPDKMRTATVTAIECACRAQRGADALLVDVIGDQAMDLHVREFAAYLARVLRGEEKPRETLGSAGALLVVT